MELERIALEDEYFVERKLYPNVDFYSGIIFRALGLPPAMFTPVFAVARTVGWVAHWNEMMTDPETRILRPRQLYAGPDRAGFGRSRRSEHPPLVEYMRRWSDSISAESREGEPLAMEEGRHAKPRCRQLE